MPIYALKKESRLKDFVETSDNPFDSGKKVIGLKNKRRKNRNRDGIDWDRITEEIDKENDLDIKQELKKGNIITVIQSSLDC